MIESMNRGLDLHYGAVIVGVFVDQIGSFAMGLAIALCLPVLGLTLAAGGPGGAGNLNLAQALYEASCIACGVAGGFTAARLARRSMVAHGIAVGVSSLGVSTALGVAMNQEMFDARGIFFAAIALVAGPLGGWLASLLPVRRLQPARG
jgi:putative membrane protein (TIGR04086 family)